MAWRMAGFELEHGATRHAPEPWGKNLNEALGRARAVAERNRVHIIDQEQLAAFKAEQNRRSLYIIDVRTPDEFLAGHRPDSSHAWGVQLVQSIDKFVATRNARLVLIDNYQVRALMTASWLVQAGWADTFVLSDPFRGVGLESGTSSVLISEATQTGFTRISPTELNSFLAKRQVTVIDFSDSLNFQKGHIPGAWFAIRSRLAESLGKIAAGKLFVATGFDPALTALAAADLTQLSGRTVAILDGGSQAWKEAGFELATGMENLATEPDDIFLMPFLWGHFEDQSEFEAAANAYFEWELQLPEQLHRASELEFSRRGVN
jgi:rhodanese-related sulfurtransferase